MKILLADDHTLFREGLALQLRRLDERAEVLEAADLNDALSLVTDTDGLTLMLMDLSMPGPPWREAMRRIKSARRDMPVVVLSASQERRDIQDALNLGANGYIPKTSSSKVMIQAVQLVLDGGVYLPPELLAHTGAGAAASDLPTGGEHTLTPRQKEVLRLMAKGFPNKQIANSLNVSEGTVKLHVTAILKSLRAVNRTQAVIAAGEQGIL